jgi:hypothetical protein
MTNYAGGKENVWRKKYQGRKGKKLAGRQIN